MRRLLTILMSGLVLAAMPRAFAQSEGMTLPTSIEAGAPFSIQSSGSGKAMLYIVGPGQALRRDVQRGETVSFPAGELHNAGHYLVLMTGGSSTDNGALDVLPAEQPTTLSFLARPSRLPVGLHQGITGAVYVFDAFHNLITKPMPVSFELSAASGPAQTRTAETRNGGAWTAMDSTSKEGAAQFVAKAGGVTSTRVIEQVPGDPCSLRMSAKQSGKQLELETEPVRDCSGNPIPDGTVITFTETFDGTQTTVDAPLKRGVARAEVPAYNGAKLSVATGVVLGNEIRWGK